MNRHSTAMQESASWTPLLVGAGRLSAEDVADVALRSRPVELSSELAFRRRIDAGSQAVAALLSRGQRVYGVNTGYGDSCVVDVPPGLVEELPLHLLRYHGCGTGRILDRAETRAVLLARLVSLAQGYSAVRWQLLEALAALLNGDVLPRIPAEGSVGASGDLTPLSYVAAALVGERDVLWRGTLVPSREALAGIGLPPLRLAPKEGLALMNGTAVMTGLACLAFRRAAGLSRLACRLTALAVASLRGNHDHFEPRFFLLKPHEGLWRAARRIHEDLGGPLAAAREPSAGEGPVQDRYSLRCAPHVVGVLEDALTWIRRDLENELNSANDNPLLDPEDGTLFHGGHFYGGHVAFAMDALKAAVASVADLMDRQLALLVDSRYSAGLPSNLSGATGERSAVSHGLKGVQIAASAWTAEALKLTMPAASFSRSTECHNQDKVSMGTIASRDALRVLELTEQVAAALALATAQALELRRRAGTPARERLSGEALAFVDSLAATVPFVEEDTPLDTVLVRLAAEIEAGARPLYPGEDARL